MTRTELIAALKAAEADDTVGHVQLFAHASFLMGIPDGHDFHRHALDTSKVIPAPDRAQHYLLCAALSVLPEGWAWRISQIDIEACVATADIWIPAQSTQSPHKERFFVDAATPALALLIACLKATG